MAAKSIAQPKCGFDWRAAFLLLGLSLFAGATPAVAAEPWPQRVDAIYRIEFNGFDIGRFAFRASVDGGTYMAEGDARISALLGAFRWQGLTRSSGAIAGLAVRPKGYAFDYDGTGKSGSIKLGFAQGNVTSLSVLPVTTAVPGTVPVYTDHLKGVLDPLSAVLVMSHSTDANPCGRRIPIFDGKQRFDIALIYVRQQPVSETRPSGQPGMAYVCRVRYTPIAGHRMSEGTRHMATTTGIEVALRPVPSAGLFIPYQITIPTIAGTATLTSERVDIVTRREQIALNH